MTWKSRSWSRPRLMVVPLNATVKEMRERIQPLMPGAPLYGTKAEVYARLRQYEHMWHGKCQLEGRSADGHGRLPALRQPYGSLLLAAPVMPSEREQQEHIA